jgi:hypothetical protein
MPEPTHFLTNKNRKFPPVAIIRPTSTENGGAVAFVQSFVDDGLFIEHPVHGKSDGFFELLFRLAREADAARRSSGRRHAAEWAEHRRTRSSLGRKQSLS